MRRGGCLVALIVAGLWPAGDAYADKAPVIVIPSRPGIPTVINGRNANYAIVEGDWGLARPGHMPPTVIGGSPLAPTPSYAPRSAYYPAYGAAPARGRHEVDPGPDRVLPEPAETYHRSWSTHQPSSPPRTVYRAAADRDAPQDRGYAADDVPATLNDPYASQAPIIIAPQIGRRRP